MIADSVNPVGDRLTTIEVRLAKFLLAQLNTHRMFSRSAVSSRAVPTEKFIEQVKADPVRPVYWGAAQRGMVASEELSALDRSLAQHVWDEAMRQALAHARELAALKAHKQLGNRVLEPFSFTRSLVSGTDAAWANFFRLRIAHDAQPEMAHAAARMYVARRDSTPKALAQGEWHLPFVGPEWGEDETVASSVDTRLLASAARCARISYLTHDGRSDLHADVNLAMRLIDDQHMSPLEHPARALGTSDRVANYTGWEPMRELYDTTSHLCDFEPDAATLQRILALAHDGR